MNIRDPKKGLSNSQNTCESLENLSSRWSVDVINMMTANQHPLAPVVIEMNTSDHNFRAAGGMIIHCLLEKTCVLNYALVVK